MSRFDRHSRISPHERYRSLERRAWGSLALTLSFLAALGFCGMRSPLHQQGKSGAPQLHGFWTDAARMTPPLPLHQDMAAQLPPPPQPPFHLPSLPPNPQPQPQQAMPHLDIGAPCLPPPTALLPLPSPLFQNIQDSVPPKALSPKDHPKQPPSPATSSPSPSAPPSGTTGEFIPPAYHTAPKPPYPPALRQQRAESSLRVRISINSAGIPTDVSIITSSGYSEFDNGTRRWILAHWRFSPARRAGIPTASTVTTTINYVIECPAPANIK